MKHNHQNIKNVLAAWGREQREIPLNNEILKSEVLAKFPQSMPKTRHGSYHLPWFSIAVTGLAILLLFIIPNAIPREITQVIKSGTPVPMPLAPAPLMEKASRSEIGPEYYPYPYQKPSIPITDTRELLKIDYNASIRTRQVEEFIRRSQSLIRGVGGRIDNISSSPKGGFISFVVPASRFDSFRMDIKSLTYSRFFTENTYMENLLPQKQSIEEQKEQTNKTLSQLKIDREGLIIAYRRAVTLIQQELEAFIKEVATLKAEVTNDPMRQKQIAIQEQELLIKINALELRLVSERNSYTKKLNSFDTQIRDTETSLEYLYKQDRNIVDTAATVRGTISLNWISIMEIVNLYLPAHWLSILLILVAIAGYIIHRRRLQIVIP